MMPNPPSLLASYWTLAGDVYPLEGTGVSPVGLRERAEAAAIAGFSGLGLQINDLQQCVEQHGLAEVRAILAHNGIAHVEIEPLFDWFTTGERREAADAARTMLLLWAEALGAFQIKAGGDFGRGDWPLDDVIEEFRVLARQAAEVGTSVGLELIPDTSIADLPTALAIVKGAAGTNSGLVLDIWHIARSRTDYAALATIPRQLIRHVELCDADAQQIGSVLEDTVRRRKLPGEGDLDVRRFLENVNKTGYDGLYGVEIISDAHRKLSVQDAAHRSFNAAIRNLDEVTDF